MAENYIVGRECKVYRETAGTFGTPTWDEIVNVENANFNLEGSEVEFDNRGIGTKQSKRGNLKGSAELTLTWSRGTNADYEVLRDALAADTLVDLWFLDGDATTAGNQGARYEYVVLSESRDEPLEDGVKVTFTFAPAVTANVGGNKVAV